MNTEKFYHLPTKNKDRFAWDANTIYYGQPFDQNGKVVGYSTESTALEVVAVLNRILIDHTEKAKYELVNNLLECIHAIDWALNNTTADHESVQSDFFNILMNAKTNAEKWLNPNQNLSVQFDENKELPF